ncbi:DNA adenine methylase [Chloracidobacterium thermophilum]|uniref:site-specific DNA-methyltransferase (adenine-specific) n=1 Tax=Chloracidobacterium thermophilum (strain B) TaxID=981222 RepID=G2LKJ3_CHLTF|nr:DNA adenine methylase (dam) [Chloracidobacterium thermophilum B]
MLKARPFLKWAGGKSQLLDQNYYPSDLRAGRIRHDVEPFLGGGAVFFAIARRYPIKSAWLSDINRDLVLTYQAVQQRPAELLEVLERYQKEYDRTPEEQRRDMFLAVRDAFNQSRFDINHATCAAHWVQRAAQLMFLNKTCFNGLFRLNSKGAFNVPFGKYKTAVICDAANLLAASRALQKAEIRQADSTRSAGPRPTKARLSILIRPIVHSAGRPVSPPTPAAVFLMLSKSAWPNFSAGWTGKKTPA